MIKKTITYSGFDGVDITEDFYFNLTKAELTEKELVYLGGFANHLQKIVADNDKPAIITAFKELILSSVGTKTADGKGFIKKGVADEFEATEAFSHLFMELVTDAVKSAEFFNGVMPKDLAEKLKEASTTLELPEAAPARKFPDGYTEQELLEMPKAEFDALLRSLPGSNIPKNLMMLAMRRPNQ